MTMPDDADRGVLAIEIGLRALAHRRRDLLHPRAAGIGTPAPIWIAQTA